MSLFPLLCLFNFTRSSILFKTKSRFFICTSWGFGYVYFILLPIFLFSFEFI